MHLIFFKTASQGRVGEPAVAVTQDDLVRESNGWQIEPENYNALVSTMKNALSDTARLRDMGKESYRIVSEEINIEKMADVFVSALNA